MLSIEIAYERRRFSSEPKATPGTTATFASFSNKLDRDSESLISLALKDFPNNFAVTVQ